MRLFARPGELVVDPFSGGGTVALEAALQGRAAVALDRSPFACLVARVKTTRLAGAAVALPHAPPRLFLDAADTRVLGARLAGEAHALAGRIDAIAETALRDAARLALLTALRTAGRRDFREASLLPVFTRRLRAIAAAAASLPRFAHDPLIACADAAALPLPDGAARLVVTSPPYKDVDVEYAHLQLQRAGASRRSPAPLTLLGAAPLEKRALGGGRGATYFTRLAPALAETRRILAPGSLAFFWTGWKASADGERFLDLLVAAGLRPLRLIFSPLGSSRVAATRRAPSLMTEDVLVACLRE